MKGIWGKGKKECRCYLCNSSANITLFQKKKLTKKYWLFPSERCRNASFGKAWRKIHSV